MSVATKISYGAKRYLVTWHGRTKKAMAVETWIQLGDDGYWREVWATPRPPGSLIAAVIATAEKKVASCPHSAA